MKKIERFDKSYFSSAPWLEYEKLMKERPELFAQNEQLQICLDRDIILDYMNGTGRPIGVLFKSPYSIMVVDLVSDADGKLFAYERLLPAMVNDAVVTVPKLGDKYVLLKQYRHSLRRELIAFPRGFGENGLSAEENAAKELSEEIGASVTEARLIGHVEPDSGMIGNSVAVVVCTVDGAQLKPGYEGIKELILLSGDELAEWIKDGRITDGYTLAAFALLMTQEQV